MLLNVQNLKVSYGAVEVIRDINFSVNKGEIVTILGGNGAGKTTVLKAVCGLIPSSGGEITYADSKISNLEAHRIVDRGISMIPEGRQLFPYLTVRDNLMLGAYRQGARSRSRDNFDLVLETFPRLVERLDQLAGSLSGGEQQMVAIGRGLMAQPDLLIFDEPSLGLSPLLVEQMFGVIKRIAQQGLTIIVVEQNVLATLEIADRGYVLENGVIALQGTCESLKSDPLVKQAYLGH
jgi:branched-chain amino acid transport system ATP-binding protein